MPPREKFKFASLMENQCSCPSHAPQRCHGEAISKGANGTFTANYFVINIILSQSHFRKSVFFWEKCYFFGVENLHKKSCKQSFRLSHCQFTFRFSTLVRVLQVMFFFSYLIM